MATPFTVGWALEKIVEELLKKGLDALTGAIKGWAQKRATQQQLAEAIREAEAKTHQQFPQFEELFSTETLAREVLRVALNPPLLLNPDYGAIMHVACRPAADRVLAQKALQFFFHAFREEWERKPAFASLREQYESICTRQAIEDMLAFLQRTLGKGVPVYPAPSPPPDPALLRAYLEEAAKQKPRALWGETPYIERTVSEREESLFLRTVMPYRPAAAEKEAPPEPLEQALQRAQKLVLLGEPGMGKTTCLQHLAWQEAQRALHSDPIACIPIYVELKTYRGGELEALLAQRMDVLLRPSGRALPPHTAGGAGLLRSWLRQPDVHFLLLLDGLNEVPPEFHVEIRQQLEALFHYPQRILLSCRERDYDDSLRDRAAAFLLQGLQEEEIESYLQSVLGEEKGAELFWREIRWEEKMRSLAANPLMLFLIGAVARADPEARLPANRGQLFQRFVARMPSLRAREGQLQRVLPDVVEGALARLGWEMQERGRLQANLREARTWQLPTLGYRLEEVLMQAKDWRFLRSDGQRGEPVEFLHPLFQEYFAACYLSGQPGGTPDFASVLGERPFHDAWEEVLVMLAGICPWPVELVQWLAAQATARERGRAALVAYDAWRTSAAAEDAAMRKAVLDGLLAALRDGEADVRYQAAVALERIGDPRAVDGLLAALHDGEADVCSRAAWALGEIGDPRAVDGLLAALRDGDADVRSSAAWALGQIGDPRAVDGLLAALQDGEAHVRSWAAWALGEIGKPAVDGLLAALQDEHADVRSRAAEALGQIGDPRAVDGLLAALQDGDARVRSRAAMALGTVYRLQGRYEDAIIAYQKAIAFDPNTP